MDKCFHSAQLCNGVLWRNRSLNYACESCVGGGGSSRSGCYKKARKMSVWFMEIEQGSS